MTEPAERVSRIAAAAPQPAIESLASPAQARSPRVRRGVFKVATAAVVGVTAASGVYIKPGVRRLQMPTAHAFSF